MTSAENVRATRTGDRYHYFWASRRALRLLDLDTDLELISIEGARDGEVLPGDEVIDIGEYYGGSDLATCTRLRCFQLKHSTFRLGAAITSSELENTLSKFAAIYRSAQAVGNESKLQFAFVANRRLNTKVRETLVEIAAAEQSPSHAVEAGLLRRYMGFGADLASEADFCARLVVSDCSEDIDDVERLLQEDLNQYLPGGGTGAETAQLMDKVATLATTQSKTRTLNRGDVLLVLRAYEEDLFPAKPRFEELTHVIETEDVGVIARRLRTEDTNKLLLTAVGGVGKSVLTTLLKAALDASDDSVTIVFDCFAGGDYRRVSSKRHPHKIALTQIANELASRGLCSPLIPSPVADERAYVRTFMRKLQQASDLLRVVNPDALLSVIVDAADNAVIAANEFGERPFVGDLFREDWPANTRLVALCRPERADALNLPAQVPAQSLKGFQQQETLAHLRTRFPDATEEQAAQLHVLSTHNPRVQAMAMESAASADAAISALEIVVGRPGDPLDSLLADQIDSIAEQGHLPKDALKRLCQALATLHPAIPLDVLGEISSIPPDAIRSFAIALGRGLHLDSDTLQFRDEPTETWFRNTHQLNPAQRRDFAHKVTPLAEWSPYVANLLPQVYFEADMLDELVQFALSESGLPGAASDLQRKEIARSRARFALAAALRARRNTDAALLAVKAGELSSGHARRLRMYRMHTDLTGMFIDQAIVESLCSGRELAANWPGSNLHVEAALLSHFPSSRDLARARFHSSVNNMRAILRLPQRERQELRADIDANAVADLAMVAMSLDGPVGAADFIARWRPSEFVREVTGKLVARLADAGRSDEISALIVKTQKKYMRLAAAETMYEYGIPPSAEATTLLVETIRKRKKPFKPERRTYQSARPDVRGIVWALLHGLRYSLLSPYDAAGILNVHLPRHLPDSVAEGWYATSAASTLVGHALRARLTATEPQPEDLASPELLEKLKQQHLSGSREARSFQANIPQLLPWARCLVDATLDGPTETVTGTLETLTAQGLITVPTYETPFMRINGIAELATRILAITPDPQLADQLKNWHLAAGEAVSRSRLAVIRNAARSPDLAQLAIQAANKGFELAQSDRTDADTRVEALLDLARAVLATSRSEARALFNAADREAELVGDDLYTRWCALTNSAKAITGHDQPARSYRLFQIAEAINSVTEWNSEDLAEPLHSLHPPSYYTAISRARDRRSLDFELMLGPVIASTPAEPGTLDRLALHAFGPRKGWRSTVSKLGPAITSAASDVMQAFTRFERRLDEVPTESHGSSHYLASPHDEEKIDPTTQFADFDFTTEKAWNAALGGTSWFSAERREFVAFACSKQPADLPEVLRALSTAAQATESDLLTAARTASEKPMTLGTREALAELAASFATRFARHICTNEYRQADLLDLASVTEVDASDLLAIAFSEIGRGAHQLTYREYFSLASHLTHSLSEDDAGTVFDALAQLFDDLAPPNTCSDGPHETVPVAPSDLAVGLAGLLWSALGDVAVRRRWQAAHAVLLLVQLGAAQTLEHLAKYADGTHQADAFGDARFTPYVLHSRMWLLLALERSASDVKAHLLQPFVPWLVSIVRGPHHAANQVLAQRTLSTLSGNRAVALGSDQQDVLSTRLVAQAVELDWEARRDRSDVLKERARAASGEGRYPFFFDFQRYWCRDIADVFGSTEKSVAQASVRVAADLTGHDESLDVPDPRRAAGVFGESSTYSDHHEWPPEEDFGFYSGIHALLTLAAELAQTETGYKEPENDRDAYTEWLNRYLPKRGDGRWLSDRRDAPPRPAPEQRLADQSPPQDWPWSISPGDFEKIAGHGADWITVYATTYTGFGSLGEDVHVASALIPHEAARAFLITLQNTPLGPHAYRLPTTDQVDPFDDEAGTHPYILTGWLDSSRHHDGIDKDDERGRNISFPPTRPDPEIIRRFRLTPDADLRTWTAGDVEAFRSQIWDDTQTRRNDYESGTRGEILSVHTGFLKKVLRQLDRSLVLQVELRREVHRPYYQRKQDDEFDWLEWSAKIYLIRPDGRWLEY